MDKRKVGGVEYVAIEASGGLCFGCAGAADRDVCLSLRNDCDGKIWKDALRYDGCETEVRYDAV